MKEELVSLLVSKIVWTNKRLSRRLMQFLSTSKIPLSNSPLFSKRQV